MTSISVFDSAYEAIQCIAIGIIYRCQRLTTSVWVSASLTNLILFGFAGDEIK